MKNDSSGPNPQLSLPFVAYTPSVTIPQPNGGYLVMPGKPQTWLPVAKFAEAIDVGPDTIYRAIGTDRLPIEIPADPKVPGATPMQLVRKIGKRTLRINAAAIPYYFEACTRELRNN